MKLTIVLSLLATFAMTNGASVSSEEYIQQLLERNRANLSQIVTEIEEYVDNYENAFTSSLNAQKEKFRTSKYLLAEKLERNFQRNVNLLSSLSNPDCTDNVEFVKFDERLDNCYINAENGLTEIFDESFGKLYDLEGKYVSLQDSLKSCDQTKLAEIKICAVTKVKDAKKTRKEVKTNVKEIGSSLDQERITLQSTLNSCQKAVFSDQTEANKKIWRAARKCSVANSDKASQNGEETTAAPELEETTNDADTEAPEQEETTAVSESETSVEEDTTAAPESETSEEEETTAASESETPEVEETTAAAESETSEEEVTTAAPESETSEEEETTNASESEIPTVEQTAEGEPTNSAESEEDTESSSESETTEEPDVKPNTTTEDFWSGWLG